MISSEAEADATAIEGTTDSSHQSGPSISIDGDSINQIQTLEAASQSMLVASRPRSYRHARLFRLLKSRQCVELFKFFLAITLATTVIVVIIFANTEVNLTLFFLCLAFCIFMIVRSCFQTPPIRSRVLARQRRRSTTTTASNRRRSSTHTQESHPENHVDSLSETSRTNAIRRFLGSRNLLSQLHAQLQLEHQNHQSVGQTNSRSQLAYQRQLESLLTLLTEAQAGASQPSNLTVVQQQHLPHPFNTNSSSTGYSVQEIDLDIGGSHSFGELKMLLQHYSSDNPEQAQVLSIAINAEPVCLVCLDEIVDEDIVRILRCLHFSHQSCLDAWLAKKRQCPICRQPPIEYIDIEVPQSLSQRPDISSEYEDEEEEEEEEQVEE